MSIATLIQQAERDGVVILAEGGQVKLRGPAEVIQRWRPILAQHKAEIVATLNSAANEPEASPTEISCMRAGVGVRKAATASPGASARLDADLETLIQEAAVFWQYDEEDLRLVHELAERDPEGLRCALLSNPLRPFYKDLGSCPNWSA